MSNTIPPCAMCEKIAKKILRFKDKKLVAFCTNCGKDMISSFTKYNFVAKPDDIGIINIIGEKRKKGIRVVPKKQDYILSKIKNKETQTPKCSICLKSDPQKYIKLKYKGDLPLCACENCIKMILEGLENKGYSFSYKPDDVFIKIHKKIIKSKKPEQQLMCNSISRSSSNESTSSCESNKSTSSFKSNESMNSCGSNKSTSSFKSNESMNGCKCFSITTRYGKKFYIDASFMKYLVGISEWGSFEDEDNISVEITSTNQKKNK